MKGFAKSNSCQPGRKTFIVSNFTLRKWGKPFVGLFLVLLPSVVTAPPPPGDNFIDSVSLSGDSGLVGASTIDATSEPGEPLHNGMLASSSVWYRWTASVAGSVTIYTTSSDFTSRLAVYTGDALTDLASVNSGENEVTFSATVGTEYRIALDVVSSTGETNLVWNLSQEGRPPNDDFSDRETLAGDSGIRVLSNETATVEDCDPDFGVPVAGGTLWCSWTSSHSGRASIQTSHSNFDTVLGVYTGGQLCELVEVESDDDGGPGVTSFILLEVLADVQYQIAVGGYDEQQRGIVVLRWNFLTSSCVNPDPAASPLPESGSVVDTLTPELSWGNVWTLSRKVIYGNDDRLDVYQVQDENLLRVWESTVALVSPQRLIIDDSDGTVQLVSQGTFGNVYNLCDDEPFYNQPVLADCSGFLVGTDLVATAGHCVGVGECGGVAFVFGFRMLDKDTAVLDLDLSDVYFCQEVVLSTVSDNGADWAIVRLDREVVGRQPLRIRRQGEVASGQSLVVIGHPTGLPAKIAGNAHVRSNLWAAYFVTNLDTFGGNSGSAVFNADDFTVEGILVRGDADFVEDGACQRSKVCSDNGCSGEDATRTTEFADMVPAIPSSRSYEVFFGPCDDMSLTATTMSRNWSPDELQPGIEYCWQIVTTDECGTSTGPIWSFTTPVDCGNPGIDTDGDGVDDCDDGCPNDENKTDPGACGCGVPDTDSDGDGTADCDDGCPDDPAKISGGICGCGVADIDSDGMADCFDNCPDDPLKVDPGQCGCGVADTDTDDDGVLDCDDNCPGDPNDDQADLDGDFVGDACDDDIDNDGILNMHDNCELDPNTLQVDTDDDGEGDACDLDDDGDDVSDVDDNCLLTSNHDQEDADRDGVGDLCDDDDDNDGTFDESDNCPLVANPFQEDLDGDMIGDACDADDDGDMIPDGEDNCPFTENVDQKNSDLDGLGDACDNCPNDDNDDQADTNSDGVGDTCTVRQVEFLRGDVNFDGVMNISDPIASLDFLFRGRFQPPCADAVDFNDDGRVDITDPVATLSYLYRGGAPPPAPYPSPGPDPTGTDPLTCEG